MSGELSGTVALVTGSSRGIGAAIARRFAAEGAAVVVHGRSPDAVGEVAAAITAGGGRAAGVTGDVTDPDQLQSMRETIEATLGVVDILVANAGGNPTPPGPLEDIPLDGWQATVHGNLTATFLTLRCFLPGMKQRNRGEIITMSSTAGRRPHPQSPIPYAAAKAGIQLLTQDVALQAGPFGVRANCIAPETILTERNQHMIPAELQERLARSHALQRLGAPDDVAEAALFLASRQRSGWRTGAVIDIAGGPMPVAV
jgi:3-oxoacyl-[acyl-carrier protein] reductase